jgi:hypothetical protein
LNEDVQGPRLRCPRHARRTQLSVVETPR